MDKDGMYNALCWLAKYCDLEMEELINTRFAMKWDTAKRALTEAIKIIKAQEPKHGQWITDGDMLYCSSCEGTQINEVVLNGKQIYFLDIGEQMKYCGKCGARMDGERE